MTIQSLIDNYLTQKQEARNNRERSGKFSPSSLGRCFRAQIWNRKNEPITNPIDLRTLRVFAAGDLFHDFVQTLLPKHECEVKVETDDILGFADIVTDDAVIDIKSQHSKAFWYMKQDNYDINIEKRPNILQVCLYASLLIKPNAHLCFISKDDLCIEEYGFSVEKWFPIVNLELNTLRDYWDKKELPPAKPRCYMRKDGTSRECFYCVFSLNEKCKEK